MTLADGVLAIEEQEYRGKKYFLPIFDSTDPVTIEPRPEASVAAPDDLPVIASLGSVWDVGCFRTARRPFSLGRLTATELASLTRPGLPRVLDMPIKLPGQSVYQLPRALAQVAPIIQRIADFEERNCPDPQGWFAYLTLDQRVVRSDSLMREAPCHVDGFQGARWQPKCRINHSYTVSDVLPTAYYVQPFDFGELDEARHDFFWEMNYQVAATDEAHRWQPEEAELTLMDAYCVHRGVESEVEQPRTWLRLSFEEPRRIFDRLGNAHNPLLDYAWPMVERDIEQLGLVAFHADCHPSLRVFPWQGLDGRPRPKGAPKTKPWLRKAATRPWSGP